MAFKNFKVRRTYYLTPKPVIKATRPVNRLSSRGFCINSLFSNIRNAWCRYFCMIQISSDWASLNSHNKTDKYRSSLKEKNLHNDFIFCPTLLCIALDRQQVDRNARLLRVNPGSGIGKPSTLIALRRLVGKKHKRQNLCLMYKDWNITVPVEIMLRWWI